MKFQTCSLVVGNEACQAHCPFCVAQMTSNMTPDKYVPSYEKLEAACRLAGACGVTTCLLTGKGEPTLFPREIELYIRTAARHFPLIELQTNGMVFLGNGTWSEKSCGVTSSSTWTKTLSQWKRLGLTTVALSVVHTEDHMNQKIYRGENPQKRYPHLSDTIDFIHKAGLSVRLTVIGLNGYIDTIAGIGNLVKYANKHKVEQVTWRPVAVPEYSRNDKVANAARDLAVDPQNVTDIHEFAKTNCKLLLKLAHGAEVYDAPVVDEDGVRHGQNLCLSNCLTMATDPDNIRQLIYINDHILYDWTYEGAIIL